MTPYRLIQRYAMATFYYATDGERSWYKKDNWLDPTVSECDWYSNWKRELGPTMCNENNEVYFLDFHDNRLSGNLPEDLGLMTALSKLYQLNVFFITNLPLTSNDEHHLFLLKQQRV